MRSKCFLFKLLKTIFNICCSNNDVDVITVVKYITPKGNQLRNMGAVLSLCAAATMGLGVGDVVVTVMFYCVAIPCPSGAIPYIMTWIASGIWAAIPVITKIYSYNCQSII